MNRPYVALLVAAVATGVITASALPAVADGDFEYAEETAELSFIGIDLAGARTCETKLKTRFVLNYSASSDSYYEYISGSGRSNCSDERLALGVTITDESPPLETYTRNAGAVSAGSVGIAAAHWVPARALAKVTYRWNFVPRYSPAQCFERSLTVLKGQAPALSDLRPCDSTAPVGPEES